MSTLNRVQKQMFNPEFLAELMAKASPDHLGRVKVGANLSVLPDGTLNADGVDPETLQAVKDHLANGAIHTSVAEKTKLGNAMNYVTSTVENENPDTTQEGLIITNHANAPFEGAHAFIMTLAYANKTGNRSQIAKNYSGPNRLAIRTCTSNVWSPWVHMGEVQDASITQKGIVQLNDTTYSTSLVQAATANAVKKVQDGVNGIYSPGDLNYATLQNGWLGIVRYQRDATQTVTVIVDIYGGIKTIGTVLFTLPSGYQPDVKIPANLPTFDASSPTITNVGTFLNPIGTMDIQSAGTAKHMIQGTFTFKAR